MVTKPATLGESGGLSGIVVNIQTLPTTSILAERGQTDEMGDLRIHMEMPDDAGAVFVTTTAAGFDPAVTTVTRTAGGLAESPN